MSDIQSVIDGHHDRNRELLKLVLSKGADPNAPRDIDLHFWTSNEDDARGLLAALEALGISSVSMNQAVADPSVWNVEARLQASPLSVSAPGFVDDLVHLADAHAGVFDGWGTSI